MVSKKLMGFWCLADICLLAAGAVSVAFSIIWRKPDILMNIAVPARFLTGGLVMGIMLLATFVFSVGAIVQKNHVTIGLVLLNWLLVADSVVILAVGSMIWFFSLRERKNYHEIYVQQPDSSIAFIQDKFSCCGYFNGSDHVVPSNFCTAIQVDFINALDPTDVNNAASFCVTKVAAFGDYTLENTFTSVFGFMAVTISLTLASLCVINMRNEEERFKKIDAKRGGRGFV